MFISGSAYTASMLYRMFLCLALSFTCACGDDDGMDGGSTDEDASIDEDGSVRDANTRDAALNLPGCELFRFNPDPPTADAGFEVAVRSPEGHTNVDLELDGSGSPAASLVSSDIDGDTFVWNFEVSGHQNGELTMTFTSVNGAREVARCVYNIGGDNPPPDASVPDMNLPDMGVPDMNVPDMNPPTSGAFIEAGGLIVFEIESAPLATGWVQETALSGFTGSAYYTWQGGNQPTPADAGKGILRYDIRVNDPGDYRFRIRNRRDRLPSNNFNDCWVRLDGGDWVKMFSSVPSEWTWNTNQEFSVDNRRPAFYSLSAGDHTLEFSGRSESFSIDRVHLYKDGATGAEDPQQPVSMRSN